MKKRRYNTFMKIIKDIFCAILACCLAFILSKEIYRLFYGIERRIVLVLFLYFTILTPLKIAKLRNISETNYGIIKILIIPGLIICFLCSGYQNYDSSIPIGILITFIYFTIIFLFTAFILILNLQIRRKNNSEKEN